MIVACKNCLRTSDNRELRSGCSLKMYILYCSEQYIGKNYLTNCFTTKIMVIELK